MAFTCLFACLWWLSVLSSCLELTSRRRGSQHECREKKFHSSETSSKDQRPEQEPTRGSSKWMNENKWEKRIRDQSSDRWRVRRVSLLPKIFHQDRHTSNPIYSSWGRVSLSVVLLYLRLQYVCICLDDLSWRRTMREEDSMSFWMAIGRWMACVFATRPQRYLIRKKIRFLASKWMAFQNLYMNISNLGRELHNNKASVSSRSNESI